VRWQVTPSARTLALMPSLPTICHHRTNCCPYGYDQRKSQISTPDQREWNAEKRIHCDQGDNEYDEGPVRKIRVIDPYDKRREEWPQCRSTKRPDEHAEASPCDYWRNQRQKSKNPIDPRSGVQSSATVPQSSSSPPRTFSSRRSNRPIGGFTQPSSLKSAASTS
jgi:ribosomal protein L34E